MLRSKAFVHRNKKGNVVKVVKEHYLRDDISCSSKACTTCTHLTPPILASDPPTYPNTAFPKPHYLIPDTNVFLHQMDLLEKPFLTNIIVLQVVLEEVKHRSAAMAARLKVLMDDADRHFCLFSNEHHRDTYVERLPEESPNDRNDRAIRVATKWYTEHLTPAGIQVIMLSNDTENRLRANASHIPSTSVLEYVQGLPDHPELLDVIVHDTDGDLEGTGEAPKFSYPHHISPLAISSGVKSGNLLQGTLNISQHNYLEGSIYTKIQGIEQSVLILGRTHLNRATQGDVVAVQLLPKEEWRTTPTSVVEEEDEEGKSPREAKRRKTLSPDEEMKDVSSHEEAVKSPPQPTAKVVGIVRRQWRHYCGFIDRRTVKLDQTMSYQNVLFFAMDRRLPKIRLRTRQAGLLLGQRIVVTIDSWAETSKYPMGHFVRALGAVGDKDTETEVLLLEHDCPHGEFSRKVLACLPEEGENWVVQDAHLAQGRRDLRDLPICSIDPPGCTDIDDALHVQTLPNGNYQVGVHIADVTHFVRPGTPMDVEAASRGTTVYLVNKRIDMLPSLLGTNLCSLRSNVERLAFSCLWEMTPDAQIVGVEFTKSVIASKASLTYEEAQLRIDDPSKEDAVTKGIRVLNILAKKLRARRMERGALTLASPEVRFALENDSQDPVDVEMKEMKETNALVEEFMLLANISVAEKIFSRFPEASMLRYVVFFSEKDAGYAHVKLTHLLLPPIFRRHPSTRALVSFISFISTSTGSCESFSRANLTSGLAKVRAPRSIRRARSFLARILSTRIPLVTASSLELVERDEGN
ncbi:hypothetical protein BJ684DRAFT_10893 [Piptocephalis cylindrospora]|uniref:Ribosomal RNA-processing protein 44 n=1 Tax=Piptocephalis cylindrospora TaxID=1907219 RepID=A0A4P9Y212_9FUNG|nr:hypothetical protein BJ684DRAFT_10893 [Piptocephalis cylindrospora]|eukprot:RKP12857.1 hypothetical protein BJ684DRAFT_10893 [Piptocephalis cylindrospora]